MADTPTTAATAPASSAPASTPAPSSSSSSASAPTSTYDIAASVVKDIEGGGDGSGQPEPVVAAKPATDPKAVTPSVDEDDWDSIPEKITDSLGRERVNLIPHTRVKTILTKREQKQFAALAKELGLTVAEGKEIGLDQLVGSIKERNTRYSADQEELRMSRAVEQLIRTDHKRFMEIIGDIDPVYKEYVRGGAAPAAAPAAAAAPVVEDDPEPEPDYDLGNGQFTYSLAGQRKREAWRDRQWQKKLDAAEKKLQDALEGRLKPVDERVKAADEAQEYAEWHRQTSENIRRGLEIARQWPKFTENEQGMLDAMAAASQQGRRMSIAEAYMQVVVPQLAGDRTKIRQQVLDEINAAPRSSSAAVTPAAAPKPDQTKPMSTGDVARQVMKEMGAL